MGFKITAEGALNFMKWSTYLTLTWPLRSTATKFQEIIYTILWHLSIINVLCYLLPTLYVIYVFHENSFVVTSAVCYAACMSAFIIKSVICRWHRKRRQSFIVEMENFLKTAKPHEREIFEKYVNRFIGFYSTLTTISYGTPILILCGLIFGTTDTFLMPLIYPFPVDSGVIHFLLIVQQTSVGFECSASISMDCQTALSMWFTVSKLEILAKELGAVRTHTDWCEFVKKHQRLLRLANDATSIMSLIALTTATCFCVIVVASCLQLVDNYTFFVISQFVPLAMIGMACLYVSAWAADSLIDTCNMVGNAAYSTPWMDMSPTMRKNVLIVLHRSQQPAVVSIGGLIPSLTLHYYGCFVSAAVSYFMTLRAIIANEEH